MMLLLKSDSSGADHWGTRAHEAELEMLRHLVADSAKYNGKNWHDCTGKL